MSKKMNRARNASFSCSRWSFDNNVISTPSCTIYLFHEIGHPYENETKVFDEKSLKFCYGCAHPFRIVRSTSQWRFTRSMHGKAFKTRNQLYASQKNPTSVVSRERGDVLDSEF